MAAGCEVGEYTWNVRRFHESASGDNLKQVFLDGGDFQRASGWNVGHRLCADCEDIDLLVQRFVVPDILQQGGRGDVGMLR